MHNAVGNHAQQLYLRELVRVGEDLAEIKEKRSYQRLKQVFGYLQQSEILFSMGPGNTREGMKEL